MVCLNEETKNVDVIMQKSSSYRDLTPEQVIGFARSAIDMGISTGYTFMDVANLMDVDRKTIYRWYHGENVPDFMSCFMLDLLFCGGNML